MFAASRLGYVAARASRGAGMAGARYAMRPSAPHALVAIETRSALGARQVGRFRDLHATRSSFWPAATARLAADAQAQTGRRWMCAEPNARPEPTNRNPENLPTPVKVVAATKTATKGALYMVLASATVACGYFIVRELMPSCAAAAPPPPPWAARKGPISLQ